MLSCDTLAVTARFCAQGSNTMAKNSDRPLGEAQPLIWFPPQDHGDGEMVECTYISIPQAAHTYGVLGSRPYWIWGFEMGVNERGVAIGNEAQGSRDESGEMQTGLLGMDLLRLGLERGATAREAVEVITGLLEQYGQRGNASRLFERRYENSYMVMDPDEIWVLETAGRRWIARQIHTYGAISNCYSIEREFDLCSGDLERHARENGWLSPGEPFNFAKAYTLPAPRQTNSVTRWRRLNQLLEGGGPQSILGIRRMMRDHYEDSLLKPRFGAAYGTFPTICMHAMTWDACQTTASMQVFYQKGLGPVARHAMSLPCCSVYLPVYLTGWLPACMEAGGEQFEETSLWWLLERLAMAVSADYERFAPAVQREAAELEEQLDREAKQAEAQAAALMEQGENGPAAAVLNRMMESAAERAKAFAQRHFEAIRGQLERDGGILGPRREFLEDYCRRTGMELV